MAAIDLLNSSQKAFVQNQKLGTSEPIVFTHADTELVIKDQRVNYVAFTGSVPGGEMVEKAAAGRFIGVGLELGGKNCHRQGGVHGISLLAIRLDLGCQIGIG